MAENFKVPDWCSGPGDKQLYMLEILKDGEVLETKNITKGCFYLGRNSDRVDYVLNHASCSRVHAALLFNPLVERFFLRDFGSANSSFVSGRPLKANHMEYIPFDVPFSFGASTRVFRLQNRSEDSRSSSTNSAQNPDSDALTNFDEETQRNTALNEKITVAKGHRFGERKGDSSDEEDAGDSRAPTKVLPTRGRSRSVTFSETVDFINLHEIDENVGQFGDLARTNFNPKKRRSEEEEELAKKARVSTSGSGSDDEYVDAEC